LTLVAIEKYVWDSNDQELTSGSHFVVAGTWSMLQLRSTKQHLLSRLDFLPLTAIWLPSTSNRYVCCPHVHCLHVLGMMVASF
jgi:hypothetical protein